MKSEKTLILGMVLALCLIYTALVTSIEAVCYWTPGYFETEYEKYDVLSSLPEMSMSEEDGLMAVTHHMMKYLRGDKDTPELQIEVSMGGTRRGFFTEREILHMEDVRNLFVGAQWLRTGAVLVGALAAGLFAVEQRKEARLRARVGVCQGMRGIRRGSRDSGSGESIGIASAFALGILIGTAVFLFLSAVLGALIASDFTGAFIAFHHLFFTNDLWILDPSVDMLVNIVPEGFFLDTAVRILSLFAGALLLMCAAAGGVLFWEKKQRRKKQATV